MAIVYICKKCRGTGRVEKKLLFSMKVISCRDCNGLGKRKYIKKSKAI